MKRIFCEEGSKQVWGKDGGVGPGEPIQFVSHSQPSSTPSRRSFLMLTIRRLTLTIDFLGAELLDESLCTSVRLSVTS